MTLKGNYFAGVLACQNLGDCSLCDSPLIPEPEQASEKQHKKFKKNNLFQDFLSKFKSTSAA